MRTGAIIIADGHKGTGQTFSPMLPVGDSTAIRRIIITMKQAGIEPIVVITGRQAEELEKHIAKLMVICLKNEQYENSQMFEGVCMGLDYIKTLCDRVLVLPAKFPVFFKDTVWRLLETDSPAVCPVFDGMRGHPVLLSTQVLDLLSAYGGESGLRGALLYLEELGVEVKELPVEDQGIILAVETDEDCESQQIAGQRIDMYPRIQLSLERNEAFFGPYMAQFLSLIAHTGSMQTACRQMHMSYTKGWKLLKVAQEQLGFSLLVTRSGGADGGFSQLTKEAEDFLSRYLQMEQELKDEAERLFEKYFLSGECRAGR